MAKHVARILSMLTPKRRWAQFSLASMLLGLTAICVGLGLQVNRVHGQRNAVAALKKVSAAVVFAERASWSPAFPRFLQRWVGALCVEPAELVSFRHAKQLHLDPAKIEPALALLPNLVGLRHLDVEGLPLSESNVDVISSLCELRELEIAYTALDDSAIARLEMALPNCSVNCVGDPETLCDISAWLVDERAFSAVDDFARRFADEFDREPFLMYVLAEARRAQGDEPGSLEIAAKVLAMNQSDQMAHFLVYRQLQQRHWVRWAERELRTMIEMGPLNNVYSMVSQSILGELLHDRGEDLAAAELMEKAIESMEANVKADRVADNRGLALEKFRARLHFFRACRLVSPDDKAKQVEHLVKAAEQDPTDTEVLIALYRLPDADAKLREQTMEWIQKAAQQFRHNIRQNPEEETSYNQLAWLIANTEGDFQEALLAAQKSLELRPNDPGLLDTLGHCYYALGDLENAVKYQSQAVKLNPHSGLMNKQFAKFQDALARRRAGPNAGGK